MTLLAIDPGGTTGIAARLQSTHALTFHVPSPATNVFMAIEGFKAIDAIICEQYNTSGLISADGLYTIRLIGAIEAICWRRSIPLIMHHPFRRRPYLNEAMRLIKQQRNDGIAPIIHEADALAHLLAYEATHKPALIGVG